MARRQGRRHVSRCASLLLLGSLKFCRLHLQQVTLSAWVWEEISSLNMAGILREFLGFYSSEDGEKREGRSKVLAKEATTAENGVVMIAKKA